MSRKVCVPQYILDYGKESSGRNNKNKKVEHAQCLVCTTLPQRKAADICY